MRLATITGEASRSAPAIVVGERVVDVSGPLGEAGHGWSDIGDALAAGGLAALEGLQAFAEAEAAAGRGLPVEKAPFLTPVTRPRRILAVAANYRAHLLETKVIEDAPREEASPWFFDKPLASLNPHRAPIRLPGAMGTDVDWEAELGVVIGRRARAVPVEAALDHVMGYTLINDVSARRMGVPGRAKMRDRDKFHDWLHGKWFDTFCCVGPWIVTADEIPDPAALTISLTVNGQRYQHASTGDMIFTIPELISFASQITTLEPGDLIATGTPSGVGKASGRYLAAGDVVEVTVGGIGTLSNPVEAHG